MKKMNLIFGLLCLLTFTTFTACDDDDDNFTYYADMATVKELDGQWILQSDNCGKLVPDNSSIIKLNDAAKDGQRVIAAFNFFNEENSRNSSRSIELYDIYRVLTKDLYQMPAEKEDSIGNDPVYIKKIVSSEEHINIFFQYKGSDSGIAHFINLVTTESSAVNEEGLLDVEFRHNNEGDHPHYLQNGWVAFPLKSIPGYSENTTKGLKIKVYNGDGKEQIITYKFNTENNDSDIESQGLNILSFSNTKTK